MVQSKPPENRIPTVQWLSHFEGLFIQSLHKPGCVWTRTLTLSDKRSISLFTFAEIMSSFKIVLKNVMRHGISSDNFSILARKFNS